MLPMFKPSKEERKVTIAEVNRDIKATFEEAFAENYQMANEALMNNGFSQEEAANILIDIKFELEQEMIMKARDLLNKSILNVLKNKQQEKVERGHDAPRSSENTSTGQPNTAFK